MGGKPGEITINGLDDINIDLDMAIIDPIVTQSTATFNSTNGLSLSVPDPIRLETTLRSDSTINSDSTVRAETNSGIALDIRPLTLDVCMKVEFGRLPPTCIRQPYKHHFGITMFGVEMLGFNFVGESRVVIEDVQSPPHVVWGGEEAVSHSHRHTGHHQSHVDDAGLRIRLD